MADQITVQFAALDQASADCNSIAGNLETTLGELKSYLDQLVWLGSARDAYNADQAKWNQGAEEIRSILGQISTSVSSAEQQFAATESANARRFATG